LGGHYWSYIRDHKSNAWFKFNDVAVNRVEQIEVKRAENLFSSLFVSETGFLSF